MALASAADHRRRTLTAAPPPERGAVRSACADRSVGCRSSCTGRDYSSLRHRRMRMAAARTDAPQARHRTTGHSSPTAPQLPCPTRRSGFSTEVEAAGNEGGVGHPLAGRRRGGQHGRAESRLPMSCS
eukprot:scaffold205971_cov35-Tisochrysis_lutea.AAC.3